VTDLRFDIKSTGFKYADRVIHSFIVLWLKTRVLKIAMGKLVARQQSLITRLKNSPPERFAPEMYGKLASDLHNVVSLTNSLLDELYGMPTECINLWSTKLEEIADCNGYLDNFAESFRIASDQIGTGKEALPVAPEINRRHVSYLIDRTYREYWNRKGDR
jgi:hypothetical protein